jgi:hypothetical protein
MYIRWLIGIVVVVFFSTLVLTIEVTTTGLGGCSIWNPGKYGPLAKVDNRGFLLPFGQLHFDESTNWELLLSPISAHKNKLIIRDTRILNLLKTVRFKCEHSNRGKPHNVLEISNGTEIVYRTGYHRKDGVLGISNHIHQFAPVAKPDEELFTLILSIMPSAIVSKTTRIKE